MKNFKVLFLALVFASSNAAEAGRCHEVFSYILLKIRLPELIPAAQYHFSPDLYKKFVQKQPRELRNLFQILEKHIRKISRDDFETELKSTFDRFIESTQSSTTKYYVPSDGFSDYLPHIKSNGWVANAFKQYVTRKNPDLLKRIIFEKAISNEPEDFELLIFDDASYSGTQLGSIIQRKRGSSRINLVVPFFTDNAKLHIKNQRNDIRILFWGNGKIENMQQIASREMLSEDLLTSIFGNSWPLKTITFFDHIVPDKISSLPIFWGEVYQISEIENHSRMYHQQTKNDNLFITATLPRQTRYSRPITLK